VFLAPYWNSKTQFLKPGVLLQLKLYVKQLQSTFKQSSPLIQYLKEQKMCHIKHQH